MVVKISKPEDCNKCSWCGGGIPDQCCAECGKKLTGLEKVGGKCGKCDHTWEVEEVPPIK